MSIGKTHSFQRVLKILMYGIGLITSSIKYHCRKQEMGEFLCCQDMFTCLKWRTSSCLCSVLQEIANHYNIIIDHMYLKVYFNTPAQCKNPLAHLEQVTIQSQFENANKRESTAVVGRLFHCLILLKIRKFFLILCLSICLLIFLCS